MKSLFFKPVDTLSGIGEVYKKRLSKLGIKTVKDLLTHFPFRYEDFSKIKPIAKLKIKEQATIVAKVIEIKQIRTRKRMFLAHALVKDKSGSLRIVWFNRPFLTRNLKKGDWAGFAGQTKHDKNGLCFINPAYEKVKNKKHKNKFIRVGSLVPVYAQTKGISSHWLCYKIKNLIDNLPPINDWLPNEIKKNYNLLDLEKAIKQIHFPDNKKLAIKSQQRLSFNEILLIQLFMLSRKKNWRKKWTAPKLKPYNKQINKFIKSLPFTLTSCQEKAIKQIRQDLNNSMPMNRLLQGDVGSGKTVVGLIAGLQTSLNNYQTALMAPTEILAKQHYLTIKKLLKDFPLNIGLLTSRYCQFNKYKNKKINKKDLLKKIKQGQINIIIGTHALIQDKIKFNNLGLVIIDEQHRFGVKQRAVLQDKANKINDTTPNLTPHFLTMTATPIPRTLSLTIYGDLDISTLKKLPQGRKKIITKIIPPDKRKKVYTFIKKQIKQGRQVFIICPLIEDSPLLEAKSVKSEYKKLNKKIFPQLKIGLLHGKIKQKQLVMQDFKNKKYDILVATSVVEVGIDVKNATVMMIEGAGRFGLAQLHQFRGRVGRSKYQSYCFLLPQSGAKKTWARLKALINCEDGFALAEKDLQIRGPGQFMGTKQSGLPDFSMQCLKDLTIIEQAQQAAKQLFPQLNKYTLLRAKLNQFSQQVHLE